MSHFSAHHSAETTVNSEIEIREEAFSFLLCPTYTKGRMAVPNQSFKGGGGAIFNPKNYIADFGPLYRALKRAFRKKMCNMIFRK